MEITQTPEQTITRIAAVTFAERVYERHLVGGVACPDCGARPAVYGSMAQHTSTCTFASYLNTLPTHRERVA